MNVLVYGFYGKGNLGDDLFERAFCHLWPEISFSFTNEITRKHIDDFDVIFFGGGSFLYAPINLQNNVSLNDLLSKKIFYIGVGAETEIHKTHLELMKVAKIIAIRNSEFLEKITNKTKNKNVYSFPDIVFSLAYSDVFENRKKEILVISNSELLPKASDPHWKHVSWERFRNEFAQALDCFVENEYDISFASMCDNDSMTDFWAATEIVTRMNKRKSSFTKQIKFLNSFEVATQELERVACVISQRLHGAVLCEMTHTPYVLLWHHDKLKTFSPNRGEKKSYYEVSKASLIEMIKNSLSKQMTPDQLVINFDELKEKVAMMLFV